MTNYHAQDNTCNYNLQSDVEEIVSVGSNKQKLKNYITDEQRADTGFFQLVYNAFAGEKKKITIQVYASGSHGSVIRDAITGVKHSGYIVGSKDEDFFYGILVSSSIVGKGRREPITLFFKNPEQYERHMKTNVLTADKLAWNAKYIAAIRRAS